MIITNVSNLKKNLSNSLNAVIEFNEIITVSAKNGNAVIISEEDYNSLLTTLQVQSDLKTTSSIKDGEKEDIAMMPSYNPDEEW